MQSEYYAQQSALARLVTFFETLTPQTLTRLELVYGADARFRDPFNDVLGHAPPSAELHAFHSYQACRMSPIRHT
jgi:hypothetical protein